MPVVEFTIPAVIRASIPAAARTVGTVGMVRTDGPPQRADRLRLRAHRSVDGGSGPIVGRSVSSDARSARRVLGGALAVLVVVGASACSSDKLADNATTVLGAAAETAAAAEGFVADGITADKSAAPSPVTAQGAGVGSFPADRKIIATADVAIRARNVDTSAARLRASVTTAGGYVENEQTVTSGDPMPIDDEPTGAAKQPTVTSITMRLRVPTARFDGLLKQMNALGVVTQRSIGAQDVTSEVVDVDSRVISAKASIARMQVLYEKAVTIADIAAIEGELSRRQADLEALLSRQKELKDQTAMATVGVTLFSDSYRAPAAASSVRKAFDDAGRALGNGLRGILVVAAALLPFLVLALLFGFPVLRILRRRRRSAVSPTLAPSSEE